MSDNPQLVDSSVGDMNAGDASQQQQAQQHPAIKRDRVDEEDEDDEGGKSGRERRKIEIKFIADKSRRHITFSKRKAGIMKKAYELSVLTGTQVLLLVVSETGLVYTFTTPKLQPLVTKPEGKNLIQACLNAPEESTSPPGSGHGLGDPTAGPSSDIGIDDSNSMPQNQPPPPPPPQQPPQQQQQHSPTMRNQGPPPPPQASAAGNGGGMYMSPEQAAAYNQYLMPQQQQQQQRYGQQPPHMQQ